MIKGIIAILVLLVVGATAIGLIDNTTETAPEWSYDDYKHIPGAVSADGSLEMVETHLGQTIHAMTTGPGTITYSDGRTETVEVMRAPLDVFLMTGQSNSAYREVTKDLASPLPQLGEAYAWMRSNGNYAQFTEEDSPAMRPMVSTTGITLTADKAPAFAATVTEMTGHKAYWICGGWASRSITTFDPDGGETWTYMKGVVQEAMAAIDRDLFDIRSCVYLWVQGESDRTMAVDEYMARFIVMNDAIRAGELGVSFDHCFISLINSRYELPNEALRDLASSVHSVTLGSTAALDFTVENGLMGSDNLHWTQIGDNIVGKQLGEACGSYLSPTSHARGIMALMVPLLSIVIGVMAIGVALHLLAGRD